MLEGIEVLSQSYYYTEQVWIVGIIFAGVIALVSFIFSIGEGQYCLIVICIIATVFSIGSGYMYNNSKVPLYKVSISEEVNFIEFSERYEIINQEDKIYEIIEREDYNERTIEEN